MCIDEFKLATPTELREANGRSKSQLLEEALTIVKAEFEKNSQKFTWNNDGTLIVPLFKSQSNELNVQEMAFRGIISDPMFSKAEFARKLADYHWKLELFINEFRLIELR